MNRRDFIGAIGVAAGALGVGGILSNAATTDAVAPNILLIYADDLGFGDLGCYGAEKIPTPNLDRLAERGVRFTSAHSSSGVCTPSRYALLTGRYHWRDFYWIVNSFDKSVFKPGILTLPEMLREAGYSTACVGKWHLGWDWNALRTEGEPGVGKNHYSSFDWSKSIPGGPLDQGFDYYFGDAVINFPPYTWIENDRVVQAPDTMMNTRVWKPIKEGKWECRPGPMISGWDPYEVMPTLTSKSIERIRAGKDDEKPWFLYHSLPSPHAPIIPNDEFDGKSEAGPYGDFVVELDHHCGRILAALEETGQSENTIVLFTSDNGPEHYAYARDQKFDHWSSAPFRGLKQDIYEGGHRVPYILSWPRVVESGRVCPALTSQIDLMRTLAAVLNINLSDGDAIDSENQLPVWKGELPSVRNTLVNNTRKGKFAVRQDDWLLINAKTGYTRRPAMARNWEKKHGYVSDDESPVELYNIAKDKGQRHNLASQHPEKVEQLRELLDSIQQKGGMAN